MKRKALSLALTLLMAFAAAPAAGAAIAPPAEGSVPVSSRAELAAIANNLNGKYHLTADIDLSGDVWVPLGTGGASNIFTGVFDGQGFTISNMTITGSREYAGLFGCASPGAVIRNVGMVNVSITAEHNPYRADAYAGGVCGSGGVISNSYVTGSVTIRTDLTGIYPINAYAGGVSGHNGNLTGCYSTAAVTASVNASSVTSLYGPSAAYAGGVSGYNGAGFSVVDCYGQGPVSAITNYNTTAQAYAGGVSGEGKAVNSYWNRSAEQTLRQQNLTEGQRKGVGRGDDGSTGLTAAQMKERSSYPGWDFTSVWGFLPGVNGGYPVLLDFHTAPDIGAADTWARGHINQAYAKGFLIPELQGDYKKDVTRAEFVYLCMGWLRSHTGLTDAGLVERYAAAPGRTFTDIGGDPVLLAAGKLDITAGTGGGLFGPGETFNRQQAATMLLKVHNILNQAGGSFNTANPPPYGWNDILSADAWARPFIDFAGNYGVMSGDGGNFNPLNMLTRQESIIVFNNIDNRERK